MVLVASTLAVIACDSGDDEDSGVHDSGNGDEPGYCECYGYTVCCDGVCVDPRTDDQNCGECGSVCPPAQRCHQTTCVPRCLEPFEYCAETCLDTDYDEDHCGACDNPCEHEQVCMSGECIDVEPPE
jgi:hypothetical protein